ncbi:MAG: MoaD/ThiS family protein [Planctomycetota bacterium]
MEIRIGYLAQVAAAVGTTAEALELAGSPSAADALAELRAQRGSVLDDLVFDAEGGLLPSIIVCVNNRQIESPDQEPLSDGDEVFLFSAISGG